MGKVAAVRASGVKFVCQNRQMRNRYQSIPDRSRPGLPTTASGVTQQGICGNYATAKHSENKSRKRGGRRVKKQREVWKGRRSLIRAHNLKYWNDDWKGKRAGRYDGAKECRHIVPLGNKVER